MADEDQSGMVVYGIVISALSVLGLLFALTMDRGAVLGGVGTLCGVMLYCAGKIVEEIRLGRKPH